MNIFGPKKIYLDYASGAIAMPGSILTMFKIAHKNIANPSSIHSYGTNAKKILDNARESIAKSISAHNDEIIFTGSGTESSSLAIIGTVYEALKSIQKPHIVTSKIEHSSVLETCRMLEKRNVATVSYLAPDDHTGIISAESIKNAITENTVIVSIHMVNSEIGIIQPVNDYIKVLNKYKEEKFKITSMRFTAKAYYPYLHLDACQAYAHINLTPFVLKGVDLISFNSVKIGGPAGIAALFKKRSVVLEKIYAGGTQEMSLRPGTVPTMLAAGFKTAVEINLKNLDKNENKYKELKEYLIKKIYKLKEDTGIDFVENSNEYSVPSIINISFPYFSGQQMAIELDARGIMVSSKSACNTENDIESYVIDELRKKQQFDTYNKYGSIRISFGPNNKLSDIDKLITQLYSIAKIYSGVLY